MSRDCARPYHSSVWGSVWRGDTSKFIAVERVGIQYQSLEFQQQESVATVSLACADTGNRIDSRMADELKSVFRSVIEDESIRVLLITGSGGTFSVGRPTPPTDLLSRGPEELTGWISRMQVTSALAELPIPVIAAVDGDAFDHGLELALAADLRIASEDARFALTDLVHGTLPWDGGTQRLPRLVGPSWARDMIFTGRIVSAGEALEIGLVNRVVKKDDLLEQTHLLAATIMAGAPIATRYAKEAVQMGMDLSLSQGLRMEADLNILLHGTTDRAEGIKSFLERRRPQFRGG